MKEENFLNHAKTLQEELVANRRYLHENAEVGFDLEKTCSFVEKELKKLGLTPLPCGRGLVAVVEGEKSEKKEDCFLLRADMDALPIDEETGLDFASKNGNMHACGHDMHTAMLLGAAKLLCENRAEFGGKVKLMFQPAEEILSGAKDMIENGVLKKPTPAAGMMLHVMSGVDLLSGTVCIPNSGVSAPTADYFAIKVQGKGCHGAQPQNGIDALTVACRITLALQEIPAREVGLSDGVVLTVGKLQAGTAGNVIADSAFLEGTVRSYDDKLQAKIKKRMSEIAEFTAKAYNATAKLEFTSSTPTLVNDETLCNEAEVWSKCLLGEDKTLSAKAFSGKFKSSASEDFAYISQEIPTLTVALCANANGLALHNPKVEFDENALWAGSALMAYVAIQWLESR